MDSIMLDPEKKPVFDAEKSLLPRRLEKENAESKKESGQTIRMQGTTKKRMKQQVSGRYF